MKIYIIFENNSDVLHFNLNSNFIISDIYTTQYLYIYDIKYHSTNIGIYKYKFIVWNS